MKRKNRVLLLILVILIGIQFIGIDKSKPPTDPEKDFIVMENAPDEIAVFFRNACYDCHSHETVYPWYTHVAPVSWLIGKHIQEGRKHLNFSTWADVPPDKKAHKLEEMAEELNEKQMPIPNYTWMHPEARLSDTERKALIDWVNNI